MGQRIVRVNQLLQKEISEQLHTFYKSQTVYITITAVEVAPDLRKARVYYSVLGNEAKAVEAKHFFTQNNKEIRTRVGKKVTLKFLPELNFMPDSSIKKGTRLMELLDELDEQDSKK